MCGSAFAEITMYEFFLYIFCDIEVQSKDNCTLKGVEHQLA